MSRFNENLLPIDFQRVDMEIVNDNGIVRSRYSIPNCEGFIPLLVKGINDLQYKNKSQVEDNPHVRLSFMDGNGKWMTYLNKPFDEFLKIAFS